jgi:lysophospholipase L1-like esterase
MIRTIAVFFVSFFAVAPVLNAAPAAHTRMILVGDSTIASNGGYGDALCARFSPSVACINHAKGGRSSKSYRVEGSWAEIEQLLASNAQFATTYVLIQFGHNDQPGKGERSTVLPEFAANMRRYVHEVRATGAMPILVTPLTRRQFKDFKVIRNLDEWAQATRTVAKETNAPLLDLNADSTAAVEKVGPTVANTFAQAEPPAAIVAAALTGTTIEAPKPVQNDPGHPPFDYTHLGDSGAQFFAEIVAAEIRNTVPELGTQLASR